MCTLKCKILASDAKVTTLQSSRYSKIDLYSEQWDNYITNFRHLLKLIVTYQCSDLQTPNLCHFVGHELKNRLQDKFSLYSLHHHNYMKIDHEQLFHFDVNLRPYLFVALQ